MGTLAKLEQSREGKLGGRALEGGVRLLIVEDEPLVAETLTGSLRRGGYEVCGTVDTGAHASQAALDLRPDGVLMDVRLRGAVDGIAAAEQLRACHYGGVLVYMTAHAGPDFLARAQATEPSAYLLKPVISQQLLVTLEIAFARSLQESRLRQKLSDAQEALRRVRELADVSLGENKHSTSQLDQALEGRLSQLSARESEVFWLAVEGHSLPVIARRLFISQHTARNHLSSIYRKLGVGSRLELSTTYLRVARRRGSSVDGR